MVNSSKILTVSYGTFSCTLEGFDDSFDTMKAIAEYFRDLAADDRYFGAEPPTPDADMLARIAEREISRRVEAHEDRGKIVLRASDADTLIAKPEVAVPPAEPAMSDAVAEEPAVEETVAETQAEDSVIDEQPDTQEEASAVPSEMPEESAFVTADALQVELDALTEDPVAESAEPAEQESTEPEAAIEESVVAEVEQPEVEVEEPVAETAEQPEADIDEPVEEITDEPVAETHELETPVTEDIAEDAEASVEEIAVDEVAEVEETDPLTSIIANSDEVAADDVLSDEAAEDEAFFSYTAPAIEPTITHPDPESVAAKLSRIRSVVSHSDELYEDADYNEDEHAQDFLSNAAAELDAALAEDDAAELQETSDSVLPEIPSLDAAISDAVEDEADLEEPVTADVAEADDMLQDTLNQLMADAIPQDSELEAVTEDTSEATAFVDDDVDEGVSDIIADDLDTDEFGSELNDDNEGRPPLRARVIKMKRSEFEAAIAEGLLEEDIEDGDDEPLNVFEEDETADAEDEDEIDQLLSPEDEEDLQRELAEVEAELDMGDDALSEDEDAAEAEYETALQADAAPQDVAEDTEQVALDPEEGVAEHEAEPTEVMSESAARDGRRKFEQTDEASDLERIFDEADSQLDAPESSQRRSAIQHLRAAVAATRAEKKAGADLQKDVDDAPYRTDLADVVRPRRPSASDGARSERPVESRPAPLKLVAEQRIDTPREPIRPRRVSAAELVADTAPGVEGDSNFVEFANQMGATRLPDLLEAAAAYMSDVEGRPQFSRPMLMQKLQEFQLEDFSREDGLRSFGQLLRQGKLQKLKGGRFAVTDETEFRAETRHAG